MTRVSRWRAGRGVLGRWRRELRRRLLEPVLVGNRSFRETVLNALAARGHLVYCRLPEGNLFVDPSDRVVGSWLMWHGRWQREELEQATALLRQAGRLSTASIFVDAGANIGTHTFYALQSGFFTTALAFEPEPNNAWLLRMNVAANALSDRAAVIEAALGDREGRAVLHLHPRNKGAHAIGVAPSVDGMQSIDVPMTRLDAAFTARAITPAQIGLVWIDVEGLERDVVVGLGDFLGQVPLVLEYAPERGDPQAARELRDLLVKHYTILYRLGPRASPQESIAGLADIDGITDILVF